MDEKKPNDIVFQATNNHGSSCGIPPYIDTRGKEQYFGYFENESREQFIFVYNYGMKKATLWVGDHGWDNPVSVVAGKVPDLLLGLAEQLWLQACWTAATAFQKK